MYHEDVFYKKRLEEDRNDLFNAINLAIKKFERKHETIKIVSKTKFKQRLEPVIFSQDSLKA